MMPVRSISRRRRRRRRPGAAAVEFALILPLLMTVVLGCIDFGRFAHSYIAVTNAARTGAGFASFHPFTATTLPLWEAGIRDVVAEELGSDFDANKIDVATPVVTTDADGQERVRVRVSYPFEMLVDWPLLPNTLVLTKAVEMRFIR